jgi:hypothetical protein
MDKKKKIRSLITSLNALSYDDDKSLDAFLAQAKRTIHELFGEYNAYLTCLSYIRFHPTSTQTSIEDSVRFWARAKKQMRDFLYVMLDDHLLASQEHEPQQVLVAVGKGNIEPALSNVNNEISNEANAFSDKALLDFDMNSNLNRASIYSEIRDPLGPRMMEKIRIDLRDLFILERKENEPEPKNSQILGSQKGSGGILFFPSPNIPRSNDILSYLRRMGVAIIEGEALTPAGPSVQEQLLMYPKIIAAILVLNDDHFICPRVQVERTNSFGPAPSVCFSLGFLVGKLGRKRVIVFYPDDEHFKRPTNYFDAVYIAHDQAGSWKKEASAYFRELWFSLDETPSQQPLS